MPRRAAPHRGLDVSYGSDVVDRTTTAAGGVDAQADADADPRRPSKSQLKRDAQSVQALGAELAALPAERLAAVDMPEPLRQAIGELRRTKSFEGRRRQLQLVGKRMREADADALREALAEATIGSARQTLALHEAERWRAELIADDAASTRWLADHPATDAQQLRSLVRAARRDAAGVVAEARQPRSHRELFRFLKPLLAAGADADAAADTDADADADADGDTRVGAGATPSPETLR